MREMKKYISVLISIVLYFLLQILGSFIEFMIFGSGNGIKGYELYIPISMVIVQVLLTIFIKYKTRIFSSKIVFAIVLIIPIFLLMYFYYE
ncbi:conserved membrane hypothetical protein [Tenacibaculum litopenaei]